MRSCTHSSFCRAAVRSLFRATCLTIILVWPATLWSQEGDLQTTEKAAIGKIPALIRQEWESEKKTKPTATLEQAITVALSTRHQLRLYSLILGGPSLATANANAPAVAAKAVGQFKTETDEARSDKQVGGGSSSSGSTSLTSEGSVPAILGFAVENGALEKSTSGTTITFRGRPVQIIQALGKSSFDDSHKQIEDNSALGGLNKFSFAVSFDTSRSGAGGTFTGSSKQLSSFSFRYDIVNHRDPRDPLYDDQWKKLQAGVSQEMADNMDLLYNQVLESPLFKKKFETWLNEAVPKVAEAVRANKDDTELADIVEEQLTHFPTAAGVPDSEAAVKRFADSAKTLVTARRDILGYVGKSPIITFEYSNDRAQKAVAPQMQLPNVSNLKFIAEISPLRKGGSHTRAVSLTANASASIFDSKPKGLVANQLRDLQGSFQLDIPVNTSVAQIGNAVLSFSGKYQRIPQNVMPMTTQGMSVMGSGTPLDAALKGDIAIGQAKLTIPVKNTGVKIPISFTVANRTELIKERDVRGNIGVTFDFDTIASILKK